MVLWWHTVRAHFDMCLDLARVPVCCSLGAKIVKSSNLREKIQRKIYRLNLLGERFMI